MEREYPGTPSWLARFSREGSCDLPALCPPVQWRRAFLDLLVGNLQLRKASVSRMCWPLNLAGEAQVASGREVLASSHLGRQRNAGVGEEMWQCWGRNQASLGSRRVWERPSSFHRQRASAIR